LWPKLKMKMRMEKMNLITLCLWASVALVLMSGKGVEAYKNYTVGDSLGWYDNIMKANVDYAKWAAGKNFSLGDFLIFNTDSNHTVVQTYNQTTYKTCDLADASDDDTTEWSTSQPSTDATPTTVPVPLLKEGTTYFFSGDYDGWQCNKGQKFEINVTHGQGLPAALLTPPAATPPPTDDGNDTPAITNVPDVTGPAADTPPETDTANASDAAARIDGLFLALALMLMLPFCVISR